MTTGRKKGEEQHCARKMGQNGRQETFEKDFLAITEIHQTETYPSVDNGAEKCKNMKIWTKECSTQVHNMIEEFKFVLYYVYTRSLGGPPAPTSIWWPFGPA